MARVNIMETAMLLASLKPFREGLFMDDWKKLVRNVADKCRLKGERREQFMREAGMPPPRTMPKKVKEDATPPLQ